MNTRRIVSLLLLYFVGELLANRAFPPTKVVKLSLAVSKATYLPFSTRRFIKDGAIIENPSSMLPRLLLWVIPLPPKYDGAQDKKACAISGWTARCYVHKETEVLMFTNAQQKLVIFGFRGTEPLNLIDWAGNFNLHLGPMNIGQTTVMAHKGFIKRYGYISSWFEREYMNVPTDYTIVITGHSLGGAEATLAALVVAGKLQRPPDAVVSFGSPYPGDSSFKHYYNQVVGCDRTIRMAAKCDPFTRVPMTVPGYTHVCDGVQVDGKIGLNIIKAHILYKGYERGIKYKYKNPSEISFGCDVALI